MSENRKPFRRGRLMVYEIGIEGHLGEQWTDWFEGLTITLEEGGMTYLTGPVVDQAALHGLLKRVRDLGMPLFSVNRIQPRPVDEAAVKKDGGPETKG